MGNQGKLERAVILLNHYSSVQTEKGDGVDTRSVLLSILMFLILMLSLPLTEAGAIIWLGIIPMLVCSWLRIPFSGIFRKSLVILPIVALIGVFNPLFDRAPFISVGNVVVSRGWITFFSLLIRGLYAFQSVLILISYCGFTGVCNGLRRLHVPAFLTTQLLMVYRYLTVLLQEALAMKRARAARGYGKNSFPMTMWGEFVGQLFIRTVERASRISSAMKARGYTGEIPSFSVGQRNWHTSDTIFIVVMTSISAVLRFFPPEHLFKIF